MTRIEMSNALASLYSLMRPPIYIGDALAYEDSMTQLIGQMEH